MLICHADNYEDAWKASLSNPHLRTEYLENNDYIYLTHSRENQILTVDVEKTPYEVAYVRNHQFEEDYLCCSLFEVEISG